MSEFGGIIVFLLGYVWGLVTPWLINRYHNGKEGA